MGGRVPSHPGVRQPRRSKEEAAESIREAIALCLEVRAERGLPQTIGPGRSKWPFKCHPSRF